MEADANGVNMPENQFYRLNKSRLFKTTKINMECPRRVEYYIEVVVESIFSHAVARKSKT